MEYYTYIIYSEKAGVYYKGYTTEPKLRLDEHNNDKSRYTAGKGPWTLVYLQKMKDKTSALKREKQLKKANQAYIEWVIEQDFNLVRNPACHPA